ncbi:MAG: quinone-dependent dihydroorotate dehydrogenase [Bacteroidetes bacterium]|nr:quinone-dependent dihydroorotate dehydrogenase [Bacteroidota bacterium]
MLYKFIVRPILFLQSPEQAHYFTFRAIKFVSKIPFVSSIFTSMYSFNHSDLNVQIGNLRFNNPIGLAAGFDKNAVLVDEFANLGFSHVEIGTVTPKPQSGNDKPRLFRLPQDQAIINRMGFNNDGADVIAERLKKRKSKIIVGGNIGKNKVTPNENAIDDYVYCFERLFDVVDYFVVNVSSPNTPNLRELQEKEPLKNILATLQSINNKKVKTKPIFLKIAPDLTVGQLDDIVEIVQETKIQGVIATNTTIARTNLKTNEDVVKSMGAGGLSGKPLTERATAVIKYISEKSSKSFDIIGVGGILSANDAIAKLDAGAKLVQLYSGYIYEGPGLVKKICIELAQKNNK